MPRTPKDRESFPIELVPGALLLGLFGLYLFGAAAILLQRLFA